MKKSAILPVICIIIISMLIPVTGYCYTRYHDVSGEHWAYEGIDYASQNKWLSGYGDGYFRPENTITRAEAVKVLVGYLNLKVQDVYTSSFRDVDTTLWYAKYVEAGKNIFPANADASQFRPDEPLTREDAIYALVRSVQLNKKVTGFLDLAAVDKYTDSTLISGSMKNYFAIAISTGLISGYNDSTLRPKNSVTRAEFVTLLHRALLIDHKEDKKVISNAASGEEHVIDTTYTPNVDHGNYEQRVFELINQIRKNNGLSELIINNKLADIAELKAQDMGANNYFDHKSPTYGSPMDMMRAHGIYFSRGASENLSKGQLTPEEVVAGWMNSQTHSSVILCAEFRETGIGYVENGNIWVQLFIG